MDTLQNWKGTTLQIYIEFSEAHLCFLSREPLALVPCLTPWTITSCIAIPSYQLIAAAYHIAENI